jgi:tetratricopeptide (TPR) repeat protein
MRKHLLILSAVALLSACGEDADQKIARARQEIAEMRLGAAKVDLSAALAEKGDDPALLRMLAAVQLRMGDGDGAEATAARMERAGMKGPELALVRAEAAVLRGRPEDALALVAQDKSPAAWRVRAAAKLALKNQEGALAALREGAAAGNDPLLLRDYAKFLIEANDLDGAAQQVAVLERIAPDGFDGPMLKADIAARRGRMAEAHGVLVKLAERYPAVPEPWIARADVYDMEGKLDDAIKMTEKAAELAPADPRVVALQVQFASMKGDWEKVRSTLASQETTLDPLSANGLTYAEAMLRLNHPEQARAMFQRALTRSPNNPYARLMLAQSQMATGDAAAAYATVKPLSDSLLAGPQELELAEMAAKALESPDAPQLSARLAAAKAGTSQGLIRQGEKAMATQDWNGAVAAYSQLAATGDDAEVMKRLAMALSHLGRTDEAIKAADRARAIKPEDPDTTYMAGYVRAAGGKDVATGITLLKQASEAAPQNVTFRRSLARFSVVQGG